MSSQSFAALNRQFLSFHSSTSNLDDKKQDDEYHDQTISIRDDIIATVSSEDWYKVRDSIIVHQGLNIQLQNVWC